MLGVFLTHLAGHVAWLCMTWAHRSPACSEVTAFPEPGPGT